MSTRERVRLTTMADSAGCAAKIAAADLSLVLKDLPQSADPNLLVGNNTADDAGVYRIGPDIALVQTVDFFTPILDDPYDFGRVAAANALSDVYAMGGIPVTALNLLCYPPGVLSPEDVGDILRGGADKVNEAGAVIVGGHSIQDQEPKYGISVTGLIHPDRIVRNVGAQPGDLLVLTKPLGTGVMTTAIKREAASEDVRRTVTEGMATLNREASEAMVEVGPNAATDITGFGLLGHLWELVSGSGVSAEIWLDCVPFYEGFAELAAQDLFPGGAHRTKAYVKPRLVVREAITDTDVMTVCDPQTSGGLLISVPPARHRALVDSLQARGTLASATIGRIIPADGESRMIVARNA
ncbi:MAG: selenide, water dikinase SelD [Armatimonadetes bacterium]|nr:selenide, water dikinase SelD [Armatimonadota bacterium]